MKALAINPKNHSVIPIYVLIDGILDVLKEHCTFEKHKARMLKTPQIDSLIAECEKSLLKLI